ncbi:cytochrome C oxidase subunit II, periplasmic domain protein [Mycobacterium xenopi 4042]|uniref:Cytochrome C oxidase subunit II, periplasmic domain protein n=1 Tax=Mycobacterium xenopi 4042 TaxID=1299334 RepID=X8DDK7_MYCXE|nr:cytochrome C oxidase subunit II, periplasmic domain protein [Mycobacterium xenopi 4042]
MPEFLFKRDVMPNPAANNSVNRFQVAEITKTGAFVGRCAEMCGTYHSMMNFEVRWCSPTTSSSILRSAAKGRRTPRRCRRSTSHPPRLPRTPSTPAAGIGTASE